MSKRTQYRPDLRTTLNVPTAIHTNTTFIRNLPDPFGGHELQRKAAMAKAEAAGVSTSGKRFAGQLCREGVPNDPQAWLNESDYKAEMTRLARQQGRSLYDDTKTIYQAPEPDAPGPGDEPYRVNDAIVAEAVEDEVHQRAVRGEPAPTPKERIELGEKYRELHSGAYYA
jgi:hypothetical protein